MKKLFAVVILLIAIQSAAQSCYPGRFSETALFDSVDIRKDTNIVYARVRDYHSGAMQNLLMDVFYADPLIDSMTDRPFIILIHGGAFLAGNKSDMHYMCMEYARRGFVVATIQYRLGWNCPANDLFQVCAFCQGQSASLTTTTYEAAQDARAALRYVNANCATWNADADKIFIGGSSAGAITAYHAAFWDQTEASAFCPLAISQVGLLDTSGNSLPSSWDVKGVIDNCGAISRDSSLLNNGNIPVISFHDEFDCVVPYGYGQVMSCFCSAFWYAAGSAVSHNFLTANGICSERNTVMASNQHCSYPLPFVIKRSSCFMKRILCNACVTQTNTMPFSIDSCNIMPTGVLAFGVNPISLKAIPNPASDWCAFKFSEPARNSGVVRIYDAYGKLVESQPYFPLTTEVRVQTAAFAEGIYYAETEIAGHTVKAQFAVVR